MFRRHSILQIVHLAIVKVLDRLVMIRLWIRIVQKMGLIMEPIMKHMYLRILI